MASSKILVLEHRKNNELPGPKNSLLVNRSQSIWPSTTLMGVRGLNNRASQYRLYCSITGTEEESDICMIQGIHSASQTFVPFRVHRKFIK